VNPSASLLHAGIDEGPARHRAPSPLLLDWLSGATAAIPVPLLRLLLTGYTYEVGRPRACNCLRPTYGDRGGGPPRLVLLDVGEDQGRWEEDADKDAG
jgi:hypothetical protein